MSSMEEDILHRKSMILKGYCFWCVTRYLRWKNSNLKDNKPDINQGTISYSPLNQKICRECYSKKQLLKINEKEQHEQKINTVKNQIKNLKGIERIKYIKEQFGTK